MHRRLAPCLTLALAAAACSAEAPAPTPVAGGPSAATPADPAAQPADPSEPAETPDPAETAQREGPFPGDRVPAFTVSGDRSGKPETFESQAAGSVTVYGVMSSTCPYAKAYAPKLRQIEADYTPKGARFVWLYPVNAKKEPDASKRAWHAEQELAGVVVLEPGGAISSRIWQAELTPSVFVVDAKGTVAYTGAVDDGRGKPSRAKVEHLRLALDAALDGRAPEVTQVDPEGG